MRQGLTSLFSVSEFYKDIMNIWNNHYQDNMKESKDKQGEDHPSFADKLAQFEKIMTSTQELIDSNMLNTDLLEDLIQENEVYFEKIKLRMQTQSDILNTEEDIDRDVDENYLGGSSALLQAETILKKLEHNQIAANLNHEPKEDQKRNSSIRKGYTEHKNTYSQSLLNHFCFPSRESS